jgi:hypothetical protein
MRHFILVGVLAILTGCGKGVMDSQVATQEAFRAAGDEGLVRDYFPLVTGMTWSFGDRATTVRVKDPIRTTFGSAHPIEGLFHQDRIVRRTADNKILELVGDRWRLLFDFSAPEKASWTIEPSDSGAGFLDGATVTVISRSEAVTVPYSRYAESNHFAIQPPKGLRDAGVTDMWFVPNVGLVKWSDLWIGGVRTHELSERKSFAPSIPKMPDVSSGSFSGRILEIISAGRVDRENGILGYVLVDGGKGTGQGMDRAKITLRDDTLILAQNGTTKEQVVFDALTVGQKVEGRISGPVMESYPVQATASGIMILAE